MLVKTVITTFSAYLNYLTNKITKSNLVQKTKILARHSNSIIFWTKINQAFRQKPQNTHNNVFQKISRTRFLKFPCDLENWEKKSLVTRRRKITNNEHMTPVKYLIRSQTWKKLSLKNVEFPLKSYHCHRKTFH